MRTCKDCQAEQPETNFYNRGGRLFTNCKACVKRKMGVKDIGKIELANKLFSEGKLKCGHCKEIKNLSDFTKVTTAYRGYSNDCYKCSKERVDKYKAEQKKSLGMFYIKRFAIDNYGVKMADITDDIIEIAKVHIEVKQNLGYHLDGKKFPTLEAFAEYVNKIYKVPVTATKARIYAGHSENECTLSKYDFRSLFGCKSRGKVKVTDVETGDFKIFTSPQRVKRVMNLCNEVVNRCLLTGEIRKPYRNSINKQTLKIEYYAE